MSTPTIATTTYVHIDENGFKHFKKGWPHHKTMMLQINQRGEPWDRRSLLNLMKKQLNGEIKDSEFLTRLRQLWKKALKR